MLAIALVYWILCSQVHAWLTVGIADRDVHVLLRAEFLFVRLQLDGKIIWNGLDMPEIVFGSSGKRFRIVPINQKHSKKKQGPKGFIRAFRMIKLDAAVLMRLEDAAAAAVAAGAMRALLSSAAAALRISSPGIYVVSKTGSFCFLANICCMFSAQTGDIVITAAKYALKRALKSREKRDLVGKTSH